MNIKKKIHNGFIIGSVDSTSYNKYLSSNNRNFIENMTYSLGITNKYTRRYFYGYKFIIRFKAYNIESVEVVATIEPMYTFDPPLNDDNYKFFNYDNAKGKMIFEYRCIGRNFIIHKNVKTIRSRKYKGCSADYRFSPVFYFYYTLGKDDINKYFILNATKTVNKLSNPGSGLLRSDSDYNIILTLDMLYNDSDSAPIVEPVLDLEENQNTNDKLSKEEILLLYPSQDNDTHYRLIDRDIYILLLILAI